MTKPLIIYFLGIIWNPELPESNIIRRFLKNEDRITNEITESNILIVCDIMDEIETQKLKDNYRGKQIILYISEPITKFPIKELLTIREMYEKQIYNAMIGCVSNDMNGAVKYPLYAYNEEYKKQDIFEKINEYVKETEIDNKEFCTLINRHDWGNTRTVIYNALNKYGHITCPGQLFNNISNEECNREGITTYIKKFKFNICCENYGAAHEGYITEKLMNACMGGAIPIYYGVLDEYDERIFNKDRIIFLTNETANEVADYVNELNNNKEKLLEFYRRPVFKETASEEINKMHEKMNYLFNLLRIEEQTDNLQ
jgi:hypothetical protein